MALMRQHTLRYVALGDSTGVGIGSNRDGGYVRRLVDRLQQSGRRVELLNLCESGATSSDVLQDQVPHLAKLHPDLVTLAVGMNDVVRGIPEDAFVVHIEEIAARLKASEGRVVLANIPDVTLAPIAGHVGVEPYEQGTQVFNEHLEATAERHGFLLVDLYSFSRNVLPKERDYFAPDGFHPSGKGYDQWAQALWPAVHLAAQR